MANYVFIKTRQSADSQKIIHKLNEVCELLTPASIKSQSQNSVEVWPKDKNAFYAIQNSEYIAKPDQEGLVIGWIDQSSGNGSKTLGADIDGSYAIIKNDKETTTFFSDQFGSRTLWYFYDDNRLIVSTSQRAIVALKRRFNLNEKAIAWYLSSGCQGPFISWDQDIIQVLPDTQYILNASDWQLSLQQKADMSLPLSGTTKMSKYLKTYQKQVRKSLKQVINDYPKGKVLLPLSGGLDSRLLLALSKRSKLGDSLTLVNWGISKPKEVYDDKKAAKRVANFYSKGLLDKQLPTGINDYDKVLNQFVEAGEGRIDHFNAFADSFKMWTEFFQEGYRIIIRGDIPFPAGLCINEIQIRQMMGLELLNDYVNINDFNLSRYAALQTATLSKSIANESLIRWRDRAFINMRVPMVHAAFSQLTNSFTESKAPMFDWSLFKLYMGLPDKDKGNKRHIYKLWKKYDHSGVSSKAEPSLASLDSYFDSSLGKEYLMHKLVNIKEIEMIDLALINSVYNAISKQSTSDDLLATKTSIRSIISQKAKRLLSKHLPVLPRAYLKSKTANNISATALAYRIVLIEKIITMYQSDQSYIEVNK
ncbi:hypothetical protein [uncultured Psychrobacter sp.]|uniref:hypothetical protein n=1 Tax=uncultured Psychrobacter sp. TaxID=259303 RepID=UPI00263079FF|nr:hypothetical protein [uncultured Psychrobacter sp.]